MKTREDNAIFENGKAVFSSLFFGELLVSIIRLISRNKPWITAHSPNDLLLLFKYTLILLGIFILVYILKFLLNFLDRIEASNRWDILLSYLMGVLLLFYFHDYTKIQNIQLWYALFLIFILWLISQLITNNNKIETKEPFFVSDFPETDIDFLGIKEDARNFADRVLNEFSQESLVFGLDAPWGSGKSTYLNFCKQHWRSKYQDKIVIFDFQTLSFVGDDNIFDKFVIEFLKTIKQGYYLPNIKRVFLRYVKMLKNIDFTLHGVKLGLDKDLPVEQAFDELKETLSSLNKKIIVIIDDLDRLPINDIKTILDIVKKSFVLPNTTYILCYETENLNVFGSELKTTETKFIVEKTDSDKLKSLEAYAKAIEKPDYEKITEYFEKVVNVKKTIIVPREELKNYFISKLKSFATNADFNLISADSLDDAITAIDQVFNPDEFEKYICYIGDLRKIKRLLNILRMQISNVNLNQIDINFYDLLHLILVYVNYPNIFRLIYISETDGARGFFSLSYDYHARKDKSITYVNSQKYKDYIQTLDVREKYLLNKIFSENRFESNELDQIESKTRSNSAAFNGDISGSGKNLEDYLKLIVKNEKPNISEAYNFHFNNIAKFITGTNLEDIFSNSEYDLKFGERTRLLFFRILIANLNKISFDLVQKLIDYILDSVKNFAAVENDNLAIGLRTNIDLYLTKLLNDKGWKDKEGNVYENTAENLKYISDRVFGDNEFKDKGIIEKLSEKERGVLGVYDLLAFRIYCSQDRGGQLYNLYSALSYRTNPNAKNSGLVRDLVIEEMREISQKCFEIFNSRYITTKVNIFVEVYTLTEGDLFNESLEYVKSVSKEKNLDLIVEIKRIRSRLLAFTLFQIGNSNIDLGIGCGFYDPTGKQDKHKIKQAVNEYLFSVCFNVDEDIKNAEYFVDFLLMNLGTTLGARRGFDYIPTKSEYLKLFDEKMLVDFWKKNSEKIKSHLKGMKNSVHSSGYVASYEEFLPNIYKLLDDMVKESEKQDNQEINPPIDTENGEEIQTFEVEE